MDVEFLEGDRVGIAIDRLLIEYDEVHWAVAWGTYSTLAKKLISHAQKIRAVTFGLAFSHTDPKLVDALVRLRGTYIVTAFPGGTYHPKIYAFKSGARVAAIVGSANFTHGGLGRNHESSVLLTGTRKDPVLADILAFTARSAKLGKPVTKELADRYRLTCKRASRLPRPPRDPLADMPAIAAKALSSPLINTTWRQYVRAVRAGHHDLAESMNLLRTAQGWFSTTASFHDLPDLQRKAIAGIIGRTQRTAHDELNQGWECFGSMSGAGDFMNRIGQNDRSLADAVDSVPQRGEIRRQHFDRFAELFLQAFKDAHHVGDVATASRLLAMKRPDVFLCVSKPNITAAAEAMGFAKNSLKLDNYWDRVVEIIRTSDWYNVDKPAGREGQIWEYRAAMLDAIYYRPKEP